MQTIDEVKKYCRVVGEGEVGEMEYEDGPTVTLGEKGSEFSATAKDWRWIHQCELTFSLADLKDDETTEVHKGIVRKANAMFETFAKPTGNYRTLAAVRPRMYGCSEEVEVCTIAGVFGELQRELFWTLMTFAEDGKRPGLRKLKLELSVHHESGEMLIMLSDEDGHCDYVLSVDPAKVRRDFLKDADFDSLYAW